MSLKYLENIVAKVNYINKERILYFGIVAIITIWLYLGSPLNPFSIQPPATDEQVWLYIANGILHGQIPYLDMFDHKGPFLYLIYLVGVVLSNGETTGVWILALLSALVGLWFNYKIGYLLTSSEKASFLSTLLMVCFFGVFVYMAGSKELFALPFIFISLYLFIRLIQNKSSKPLLELLVIGICGGCVLLITPTLAILWLVIGIWIIGDAIRFGKIGSPCKSLLFILIGVLIAVIPQFIWLYAVGAFGSFIECYIYFNLGYSADGATSLASIYQNMQLLETILTNAGVVFAEIVIILTSIKYRNNPGRVRDLCIFTILHYVLCVTIICITGHGYNHYMAVILPCLSIPFAWGLYYLYQETSKMKLKNVQQLFILILCVGFVGVGGVGTSAVYVATNNISLGGNLLTPSSVSDEKEIISIINAYTETGDLIQVFSNRDYLYLDTGTFAASRFNYLPSGFENYEVEILTSIMDNMPKVILEDKERNLEQKTPKIMSHIQSNYVPVMDTEIYTIYVIKEEYK